MNVNPGVGREVARGGPIRCAHALPIVLISPSRKALRLVVAALILAENGGADVVKAILTFTGRFAGTARAGALGYWCGDGAADDGSCERRERREEDNRGELHGDLVGESGDL